MEKKMETAGMLGFKELKLSYHDSIHGNQYGFPNLVT